MVRTLGELWLVQRTIYTLPLCLVYRPCSPELFPTREWPFNNIFHEIQCNQWSVNIARKAKLRTYVTFKDTYEVEPYALSFMNRKHACRCGILPLEIETGRWQNKPVEERICKICESGEAENEFHFIFSCTLYNNIRATFLQNIGNIIPNIMELNKVSQIKTFMSKNLRILYVFLLN